MIENRLLIDQDDTLGDLCNKVHDIYANEYGLIVPPVGERHFYNMQKTVSGLTDEIYFEVFERDGLFSDLVPNPGAVEALKELEELRVPAVVCTSPFATSVSCIADKKAWMEHHFGLYWVDTMIFAQDKTVIPGRFLIDDKPKIVGKNTSPSWKHVVYNQFYNTGLVDVDGNPLRRLNHWNELRTVVPEIFA